MKHEFLLEGLNCAHCAGKIEEKIRNDRRFSSVAFTFATKLLTLESDTKNVKAEIQKIVDSVEDGVTVVEKSAAKADTDNSKSEIVQKVLLVISAVICVTVFVLHLFSISNTATVILACAATLMAGYEVFYKGIRSIIKLRIDETTLLTIAVIAAFLLGEYVEACAVTVLFAFGEWLEDIAVGKSRRDIEKLAQIKEDTAFVENADGELVEISAEDVAVGTEIVIKPHCRIPLDGVVTDGASYVDTSALTGESVPLNAQKGTELLSGMMNGDNTLRIQTTKLHSDSAATRIIKLVEESSKTKGNTDKFITKFAKVYTPVVIIIALLIAIIPSIITGDYQTWIYRALVCLVSSCPCAIVISVPLAYYAGIGAASKHGVLIKGGKYIEALAKADTFAFDKTGTLTLGKMSVTKITAFDGYTENEVLQLAASVEKMSSHPIAQAITNKATQQNLELLSLSDYTEKAGFGVTATLDGKTVSCGGYDAKSNGTVVSIDNKAIGVITVADTLRAESKSVIEKLRKLGVTKTMMLTGDNEATAKSVAENFTDIEIHANLLPDDKVKAVKEQTDSGKICIFVGDGINDAPVMAMSSCGIAMGLGSEAAIESADAVLATGDLSKLPDALKISRKTISTVKINIIFALLVKAAVIVLAAIGIAPMWLAVFADTGVSVLCVLNSTRLLK